MMQQSLVVLIIRNNEKYKLISNDLNERDFCVK